MARCVSSSFGESFLVAKCKDFSSGVFNQWTLGESSLLVCLEALAVQKHQVQHLIDMDKTVGPRNDQLCWLMQGSNADYRGHVLGVIGDQNVALSKVKMFAFWSSPQIWVYELKEVSTSSLLLEEITSAIMVADVV